MESKEDIINELRQRQRLLSDLSDCEGSELGELLGNLAQAAWRLFDFSDYDGIESVLEVGERTGKDFIISLLENGYWDEYEELPDELVQHFTGAPKFTRRQLELAYNGE